ncbi:hypothetical protein K435DRAFT_842985 [Dendrothele bispora CBS 962.96]|uniref:Uncharacterized protein n=1 Tax=Dendrothele bispora (strain CBS 962.96) TaxID=1314807 RepID=A0A4S8LBY0_DENBC|nr:hypothetical protein K435DRAFT_842985 [Dendrothele bispora CBS 962.96]
MPVNNLIKYKGYADVLVGVILVFKPSLIYESGLARLWGGLTGLRLSDASTAPGFNHSLACMTAAVGVGNVIASRCGPAACPPVFYSSLTWGTLCLLTCILTPQTMGLSSSTVLMSAINHLCFAGALVWTDTTVARL